jgi:hypothetical protein
MTQDKRNPLGLTEVSVKVDPQDYVHNDMSCWGDYDWSIEKRKELDVVGRILDIDDFDCEQIWNFKTHKTFSGHSQKKDYPIHSFLNNYVSSGRVCLMHNKKNAREFERFAGFLDYLAFSPESLTNFQIQEPGQMTPYHTDQLHRRRGEEEYADTMWRILVAITPWSFGQVFQYGNETLTHWEDGDIFVPFKRDIPHGGANFGMVPRIFLNVTGVPTEKTFERFPRFKEIVDGKIPSAERGSYVLI